MEDEEVKKLGTGGGPRDESELLIGQRRSDEDERRAIAATR